jgi:hypothetical protein
MPANTKNILLSAGALIAIGVAALWIYWHEFKAPQHDVALHQRVGEIMAEQTARVAGKSGKIVLMTIPTTGEPELKTQLAAFNVKLKTLGNYQVREYEMDTKDQDKYGVGTGLSGRRYVRTANKNLDADVMVSFIGAPSMKQEDFAALEKVPKLVAQARSVDHLPRLFASNLISVAVAARFTFPSPGLENPKTPQEKFIKRYQLVTADAVRSIPVPE